MYELSENSESFNQDMQPISIEKNDKKYFRLIQVLSFAIPIAVAVILLGMGKAKLPLGEWTKMLPHINGVINTVTSVTLILGLIFIKIKNISLHRIMMLISFVLGSVFLVTYVLYHISNTDTKFMGTGMIRYIYFTLLISHILLSIVVVRFVLMSLYYGLSKQYEEHKKTVKWAYPIWLYVSVTGVIVYLMISPYYR
jgi:putative membrane protein